MSDDKFDRLISKSLKTAELEVTTPIKELEQVIAEKIIVDRQMKRKKQHRVMQFAVTIVLLISITGAILFPNSVYAIKKQLFQTIHNIGKSININLNSDSNQLQLQNQVAREIAAIQGNISFNILVPQYIPPGYTLESVKQNTTDKQAKIIATFINKKSKILLCQTKVSDNYSVSVNVDNNKAQVEKLYLEKCEGNLISYKDGSVSLIWITDDNVMCQILGDISPDQAVEMAKSIY
jgi:hypothetical protein